MEYQAKFDIDCGVSSGFGLKDQDNIEITEKLIADSSQVAYQKAMHLARTFADDYLSNPDTGLTTVRLLSLSGAEGKISFDESKAVVKRSMLEHLLGFASERISEE